MFRQTGSASTSVKLGFLCLVCIVCLITVFESSKAATRTSSMTATTGSLAIAPNRPPSPTRPLPFSHVYTDPGLGRPISDSEEIPDSPLGPSGLSLAIEAALRGNPKPETEGPAKEPGEAKVKDKGTGTGTGTAKVDKKVDKKVETPTSKLKAKPKARPNVTVSAKSKPTRVGAAMNLTAHAEKVAVSRTSNATSELRPSTTTTDVTMMEVTPEAVVEEVKKKLRPARTSSPRLRPTDAPPADPEYVAICLAVKDQHADLSEFFRHHYYQIGIRKF
ncbi:hypothetical protein HKX48_005278 [Thoreauomyces humboldtii]|nr:hypothetical protein HKX48_005278 [Thoreauomyces humboldtii]